MILFDDKATFENLRPVTSTRPVSDIRCGIFTLKEKWEKRLGDKASFLTANYLSKQFPARYQSENLYINSSVLPSRELIKQVKESGLNQALFYQGELIAVRSREQFDFGFDIPENIGKTEFSGKIEKISSLPDLFLLNGNQIAVDLELTGNHGNISDPHTIIYSPENVHIGENVNIKAAIINAEAGPVYIGNHAVIKEGAVIIGPAAIGGHAMVGLGANIRENTTVGPFCRVAGEVKNTVFHSFSNKSHDGFLGNSYVGVACNLGANTNNSNLKNNFKPVSLYSYTQKDYIDTGEIYCGSFIGDYSKTGINTMLNTGTVIGVSCNVFGAGFQGKFIPDFSWGGKAEGYDAYHFEKAVEVIRVTLAHFGRDLNNEETEILKYLAEKK